MADCLLRSMMATCSLKNRCSAVIGSNMRGEDFIEELLLGGDDDIDLRMKLVVLSHGHLRLEVCDDFWCPYLASEEEEDSAILLVLAADVLERVVGLLIGRAARALVLALNADGHPVAVAYEVLSTVFATALGLLIRVLRDDAVVGKRPIGERYTRNTEIHIRDTKTFRPAPRIESAWS